MGRRLALFAHILGVKKKKKKILVSLFNPYAPPSYLTPSQAREQDLASSCSCHVPPLHLQPLNPHTLTGEGTGSPNASAQVRLTRRSLTL